MRLKGKTAIVTGASRGIGEAIARRFAKEGANVVVNYRRAKDKADAVVSDILEQGGQALAVQADVCDVGAIQQMVNRTISSFGGLDILVNNAGWAKLQPLEDITPELIDSQLNINIKGIILTTQAVCKHINDKGRIINISSIAAKGGACTSVYSATKAAANALTKSYAAELGPRGITVNALAPAAVETDLYFEVGLDKNHDNSLASTPLGYIGDVHDVANAALFFASDEASWITGEILQVSGGKAM